MSGPSPASQGRQCRGELPAGSRATFCCAKCRAAWHRRQREEARQARDREIRALLEVALRKLGGGVPVQPRVIVMVATLGAILLLTSCAGGGGGLLSVHTVWFGVPSYPTPDTARRESELGKPGTVSKTILTGHSYDEIWTAALMVAHEHFEIREQDKARGTIKAERVAAVLGQSGGAWVGIYIVPPVSGSDQFSIEVVSLPRTVLDPAYQNWAEKVPRDMQRVLDGQPIR